jgi:hypothetical protein
MSFSVSEGSFYGSKAWANWVLRCAISILKNESRDLASRQVEIYYWLFCLECEGFDWQARRLRNHINLAVKKGSFTARRADPIKGAGGLSL